MSAVEPQAAAAAWDTTRGADRIEQETMRRVAWRLVPLLMLGYFCASLDRANVGMAATTMSPDLGFSHAQFGFGAGVFFLGYFIAEIPSNLALHRFGAQRWIARILLTWGIVSALTALVWSAWSFYAIRCLLGLAEAGYFPGVLLYITWWFPARYRSRATAVFMSAGVASQIIGPPVGGLLLRLNGTLGLAGWQWLFIAESLPSIIMCFVIWRLLTDRPIHANWLSAEQKSWLEARLGAERQHSEAVRHYSLAAAFASPKMWLLTLAEFGHQVAGYGLVFFMPLIVKGLGVQTSMIGVVSAIPFLFGFIAMIGWGYSSDRTGERRWHSAASLLLSAAGLAASILVGKDQPVLMMVVLCITVMGNQSFAPCFWSIPSAMLTGTAAAGGLAMINSLGNLGGWFGPTVYGLVRDASGSANVALLCLAIGPVIGAVILLLVGHERRTVPVPAR